MRALSRGARTESRGTRAGRDARGIGVAPGMITASGGTFAGRAPSVS
jgi:hypothetical protein